MVTTSASWLNLPAFQMMALGSVFKSDPLDSCGLEGLDVVRLPAAQTPSMCLAHPFRRTPYLASQDTLPSD